MIWEWQNDNKSLEIFLFLKALSGSWIKKLNLYKNTCMATAKTLDKEINHLLPLLTPRQKETVLTVVKTFAEEEDYDLWTDKEFLSGLDRRTFEYESGKIKPMTLDELETCVRKSYKAKSGKKK